MLTDFKQDDFAFKSQFAAVFSDLKTLPLKFSGILCQLKAELVSVCVYVAPGYHEQQLK